MKSRKTIIIGCIVAGILTILAGCSESSTQPEPTPTLTPEATESASPEPEVSLSPTQNSTPQTNAGGQEPQEQGEKMTALFVGRADPTTIEIMVDEEVKTAKLDEQMQEKMSSLELQDNQTITITYVMQDGQILVKDIIK